MKAIVQHGYGPPEVLRLEEVEKPTPKDNEVLIRVFAATVSSADCAFLAADSLAVRLYLGLRRPKYPILGTQLAGRIEAVGKDVRRFEAGDHVFGASPLDFGAHAQYKCLPEDGRLAKHSARLTLEEAVGLTEATTALIFLRDVALVQPGQRVLVNGASGAVGCYAVQLAKHFGAEVTGVCSTANVELVASLGADAVIDYTRDDFTMSGQRYDIIFDTVGKRSFSGCQGSLAPKGVYLSTVPTPAIILQMLLTSRRAGKRAKFATAGLMQTSEHLATLNELVEAGALSVVIDRCYPLAQTAEAYRYVGTGHKKGSVVIAV